MSEISKDEDDLFREDVEDEDDHFDVAEDWGLRKGMMRIGERDDWKREDVDRCSVWKREDVWPEDLHLDCKHVWIVWLV